MNRDLFYEVILFVEERGYKGHLGMLPVMPLCATSANALAMRLFWQRKYEIIFNHKFAKAFFGERLEKSMCQYCHSTNINPTRGCRECGNDILSFKIIREGWQYHLQKMVLEEEPLKYLEKEYQRIKTC